MILFKIEFCILKMIDLSYLQAFLLFLSDPVISKQQFTACLFRLWISLWISLDLKINLKKNDEH